MEQKISRLALRAPPENGLVERNWRTPFLRCFLSFFFILGELCRGLVLVSSPVAKCTYKQHRYRNKCIATGPIYAWALSASGVSPPLKRLLVVIVYTEDVVKYTEISMTPEVVLQSTFSRFLLQ